MIQYFKFHRLLVFVCILSLLNLMAGRLALAGTNNGSRGNTISGRPSIAIVEGPGGIKVNTFLGNMFLPRTDLQIPGRGLPIEVQLTYNSDQNNLPSPFGFGWRFNYHMSVIRLANDDLIVTWADGRRDLFLLTGGVYTPVNEGVFATLEQVTPNMLRLTTKEQIQYLFDKPAPKRASFLKRIEDPNGNALTFTYDSPARLTGITDASGRKIFLSYTNGRVTTITDSNISPPRILRYGYDALGNQTSFTDPLGNVTTYSYDNERRMTKITDALGITDISYAPPNLTVASISRSTLTATILSRRSFSYDFAMKTTTVADILSNTTTAVTQYKYDINNRLTDTINPLGHTERRTYDSAGNIASVIDANGNVTQYTYDSRGNVQTVTDALGKITTFTYEPIFNKVASVTDANGHTTTLSYDSRGNFRFLVDPLVNTTEYSYDSLGQLVSRRNARGFTTTFTYYSSGNRTSITDPLNHTKTVTYDGVGNVISRTDANNNTTFYSYDARDRLRTIVYPDSTQGSLTYDSNDNLVSVVGPNINQTLAYDADNQVIQVKDNLLSKTISYQYDGVGNRIRMTGPDSEVSTYRYDLASRLDILDSGGQQFDFDYDNGNRLIKLTLPNGSFAGYSYDPADNLLELGNRKSDGSVISIFVYEYDNVGNRTHLTQAGGEQINYSYDNRNQLIRELRTGGMTDYDHQFAYDEVGNRTQFNTEGVITTYSYNAADQLSEEMTGVGTTTYEYDSNGNQIRKIINGSLFSNSYDFRDRLVQFNSPTASASYAYDVLGRRISKSVGGTTTRFLYDGLDVIAEYNESGTIKAQYINGPGIDLRLAKFINGNSFYFMRDGLNSVRNIVDAVQGIHNSYDYDAWGNVIVQVENVINDYAYTGRELDKESGLYYYRERMYDPLLGRFTRVDPIDNNLGRSLYVYVDNNPVNLIDPTGEGDDIPDELATEIAGGIGTAAGAAIGAAVGGPVGAVVGAAVGAAIGLVLKGAFKKIVRWFKGLFKSDPPRKMKSEDPPKPPPPYVPGGRDGGTTRHPADDRVGSNGHDGPEDSYAQGSANCAACSLTSHNVSSGMKAVNINGIPSLLRANVTAVNNSNLSNDFADIGGSLSAFNFLPRTLIEPVEFSFLQGTLLSGGDLVVMGDATARVNGVLTNITFDAAKIEGVITFQIRTADKGMVLAGGTGEAGRAALELAITPR